MINFQLMAMFSLIVLTILLFFIGRHFGLQVLNHPTKAFSRISLFLMKVFEILFLIAAVYVLKNKDEIELIYHHYFVFEKVVVLDGNLISTIAMVFISLFAAVEAGYRLVFKNKYEKPFYALLFLFSLVFYYLLIFIELPKKTFPIETYDGHLNPKVIKMKEEEEKRLKVENDLKNQSMKEVVK